MRKLNKFFALLIAVIGISMTAKAEEPAKTDYTDAIKNASVAENKEWEGGLGHGNGGLYKTSAENFDFTQTITLPAGQYKMTVKAAYRYASSKDKTDTKSEEQHEYDQILSGVDTHLAKLYAKTASYKYEANVQNRWEGASDTNHRPSGGSSTVNGKFVPNSSDAVKAWFDAGKYVNELIFNVQEEGQVKIGIIKEEKAPNGDYTNIGAWTLTRLGDAEADPEKEEEEPETPAFFADGDYLIVNTQTGCYLGGGNDWGTHATLLRKPQFFTFAHKGNNAYTLDSHQSNGGDSHYLNTNLYCDAAASNWTFTKKENGSYTISNGDNYLSGDGAGKVIVTVTDATAVAAEWTIISRAEAIATLDNATLNAPVDATFYISNPECKRNAGGWNNNSADGTASPGNFKMGSDGSNANCAESYHSNNGFDISQELNNLKPGVYRLGAHAFYRNDDDNTGTFPYIYVNEQQSLFLERLGSEDNMSKAYASFLNGNYAIAPIYFAVAEGATIKIGAHGENTSFWNIWGEFGLTYYGADATIAEVKASSVYAEYNEVTGKLMNAEESAAMESAKAVYEADPSDKNLTAFTDAVSTAKASVVAYANAPAYFAKMKAILDNTNVYTKEAYDAYYSNWLSGYEALTLPTETAAKLTENSAYSTGWHSTNYIDDILLSAWTIGGKQAKDYDLGLYINTWSTEGDTDGSEFRAPFFEYWIGDGEVLGATTIQAKVKGLDAEALYSFTIRARVRQTNEKKKIANGITMQVGDGESVDISSGAQFNGGAFYIGNFTAQGGTDAEGTLTVTITVAENSNISWFSFYNAKYTKGEDLSGDIANYEFALANATAALSKSMDPNLRPELEAVVEANKNVSKTNKKALEAAKQALEAAVEKVAKSIAALEGSNLSEWTTTKNNGKFEVNTWSTEGKTDGSDMVTPFAQNWIAKGSTLTDVTMGYKLTGQQVGFYKVSGLVRSLNEMGDATPEGSFIFANEAISRAYVGNACKNGVYANPIVYAYVDEDGELTLGFKTIRANVNWIAWKNLTVEYVGAEPTAEIVANLKAEAPEIKYVTAEKEKLDAALKLLDTPTAANYVAAATAIEAAYKVIDVDYTELQAAYDKAAADTTGKKFGFEKGDYAPYLNATHLQALQDAKKMLTDKAETSQQRIIAITEALDTAKWVVNTEDVDAIYNGDFAIVTKGANYPDGWARTNGWGQMQTKVDGVEGSTAYYNQPGSLVYGQTGVYTMPLAANTYYDFSFKYRSHEEGSNKDMTVYILNQAKEGLDTLKYAGNASKTEWVEKKVTFKTGAAGNYVLTLANSGNTWLTDVSLVKTPATEVVVTIEYDYATMMLPFDAECPEGMQVFTCAEVEGSALQLTAATSIKANTPYIVNGAPGKYNFSGISVAKEATYTSGLLTGTYAEVAAPVDSYVLQNGAQGFAFYHVAKDKQPKVGANRCYLTVPAGTAKAPMFSISRGEDTTGIENSTLNAQPTTVIYDLTGRKVTNMVKGNMYIVNGKKVIVK